MCPLSRDVVVPFNFGIRNISDRQLASLGSPKGFAHVVRSITQRGFDLCVARGVSECRRMFVMSACGVFNDEWLQVL